MASCPKGSKNAIKNNEKVSKIEVLGGLGPPWVTMWGPRGVGVTFLTFLMDFGVILGTLLDVSFADFRTVGVSGAQGDLEVVSRGRFVRFFVSCGFHFGSIL